jgi:hypothetical protein
VIRLCFKEGAMEKTYFAMMAEASKAWARGDREAAQRYERLAAAVGKQLFSWTGRED